MAVQLGKDLIELFRDSETVKVLATVDENGSPHAVVKQSIEPGEDGNLVHLELLESSRTGKNLLRSLWFGRKVSVTVIGKGGRSYQIKGRPVRSIIAGPVFRQNYEKIRERDPDADLAAVWIIEPEEVIDESFSVRLAEEKAAHPLTLHLDRIAVASEAGA